ncbi:hypothetical protein HUJ05_001810 [Dendroctonus ponderosae]|nr:hypothetical protein HUJ05_001810 [Dendroctonus ponderosae]
MQLYQVMLQIVWPSQLSWDESVPLSILTEWRLFYNQLKDVDDLTIPRNVLVNDFVVVELHGFSDASELAYGACVYLRAVDSSDECHISSLCAKTRVAPFKTITIPRLQLCGAVLLSELVGKVVLSWIRAESHNFKIFVGNRISQIQTLTTPKDWHYVSTTENPADLLSRSASPGVLMSSQLWWHGPSWLSKGSEYWPVDSTNLHESELQEQRQTKINCFSSNG